MWTRLEVIESFFDKKIDKANTKCYNIIKIEVVSNRRLRMSMNFDEIDKEVGKYEYYREENLPIESESFELLPDRMPDLETEGTDIEF